VTNLDSVMSCINYSSRQGWLTTANNTI